MKKIIVLGLGIVTPVFAFAAATVGSILDQLIGFLNYVVPALITIAVVWFIWGVIQFMTSGDEEQKKMARSKIINGLIGLFVIVAFWGIIAIVQRTFGVGNQTQTGVTPCVPNASNRMGLDC